MLETLKTTKGRILVALFMSLLLITLWVLFDLSFAILPALIVIQWTPLFRRQEPVSPRIRYLYFALVGGLIALLGIGVLVFVMKAS